VLSLSRACWMRRRRRQHHQQSGFSHFHEYQLRSAVFLWGLGVSCGPSVDARSVCARLPPCAHSPVRSFSASALRARCHRAVEELCPLGNYTQLSQIRSARRRPFAHTNITMQLQHGVVAVHRPCEMARDIVPPGGLSAARGGCWSTNRSIPFASPLRWLRPSLPGPHAGTSKVRTSACVHTWSRSYRQRWLRSS